MRSRRETNNTSNTNWKKSTNKKKRFVWWANPTAADADGNKTGNTTGSGDSSRQIAGLLANNIRPLGAVTKNKTRPRTALTRY